MTKCAMEARLAASVHDLFFSRTPTISSSTCQLGKKQGQ